MRAAGALASWVAALRHASYVLARWPTLIGQIGAARTRRSQQWRCACGRRNRGAGAATRQHWCATSRSRRIRGSRSWLDRAACPVRVPPQRRSLTPNSPRVLCACPQTQSAVVAAEQRRRTCPSSRSSSTIMSELGRTRRHLPVGAPLSAFTRCPDGAWRGRRSRQRGRCGWAGGVGQPASRRRAARLGRLGTWASACGARRAAGRAADHRCVTLVIAAFCCVLLGESCSRVRGMS